MRGPDEWVEVLAKRESRIAELERELEIERTRPITAMKLDDDQAKLIEAQFALDAADRVIKALRAQVDALTADLASSYQRAISRPGPSRARAWGWTETPNDCADDLEDALEDTLGDLLGGKPASELCTPASAPLHQAPVPAEVHERGWQWRPTSDDTAFAPPFGTIRSCLGCGCLVSGGPTNCVRCAKSAPEAEKAEATTIIGLCRWCGYAWHHVMEAKPCK